MIFPASRLQNLPYSASDVVGGILIGGLSTRMGQAKAYMRPYGEKKPNVLQRTYELLSSLVPSVWLSCRHGHMVHDHHCVIDARPNMGPLGGVHAVLSKAKDAGYAAALVLSCDLPCMTYACLERLLCARHARERNTKKCAQAAGEILATTCSNRVTQTLEPLVAIYEVRALPLLDLAIAHDERRLRRIIPDRHWQRVLLDEEESVALFNMNTPQDVQFFNNTLKIKK